MQTPSSTQETVDLTVVDEAGASENAVAPNLLKLYVDNQVRRWDQVSLEFVTSPMIEYAWPHPAHNFQAWYGTVMATSEYLASRISSGARAQTWISEWRLVRLAPNMATDFTSVTVPLNELSMRECAVVLQTMFFEVGFKFGNLVPEWFRVCAPKAEVDTMRRVTEELQHLLNVELLEWLQVISGVQCRVVPPLDVHNLNDHSEEMKPEYAEGDSLMSSYEAELLGSECVTCRRKAGVRVHRSPASSSFGESESKRQQRAPPRPSSIPSMSSLMYYRTSTQGDWSMATPSDMSATRSVSPMPSSGYGSTLFGATATGLDESNLSGTLESRSSGNGSSSASSMWSMTGGAPQHVQFAHALQVEMVFAAQGGVTHPESSMGVQVTEAVLPVPPMPTNSDDVVISESGRAIIRNGNRSKTSRKHTHRRRSSPSDYSERIRAFEAFKAFIQAFAMSVVQVRDDKPLRKVALLSNVRGVSGCPERDEDDAKRVGLDGVETRHHSGPAPSVCRLSFPGDPDAGSSPRGRQEYNRPEG
ncbi:hypothetical protein PHMEG_00016976 [Phytophthora megakarya]|uniref:Uncharacterized protein n=1 Tax=Phytophthora megakarya TaxID=4795 RepID=A0A225VXQ4_9STRA|nr:hypothetical protein PHMEG_00016976 [Phytophthora megakarya]